MLKFLHPEYLWFLLIIPAMAGLFLWLNLRSRQLLQKLVSEKLVRDLAPDVSMVKRSSKQLLLLLAMTFLILTAANPQVGTRLEEIKREGIDLFVVLDVSMSMKAEDIKPSRLEKAKRDVSELLKKLSGDRVGLIVFAGDAFVQFPLTADYAAADLFISAVDVESVPTPGTMIGQAIDRAMKLFSADLPTQKAIIIVSDGENTEGDVLGPIEEAKKAGVRLYTIGMGTTEGGPIPIYDQEGRRVDFKRDRNGSVVVTRLDESMLRDIAVATGGTYRRATSAGNEIDDVFKEIASLEKTEFGVKQVAGFESRYQYPLALAILLLILEHIVSERRGRFVARLKQYLPAFSLLAVVALFSPAKAQTVRSHISDGNKAYGKQNFADAEAAYKKALEKNPRSIEALFNLGNSYYKQQRFEEAGRQFGNSAIAMKNPLDRSKAFYNGGNALFKSNKFPESIEAYKQALRLNPDDDDARYNLEVARKRMHQQQKNQQQKQEKDRQNKQQNQQQNQQQEQQQDQQQPQQAKQDQTQQQQVQKKNQMPKQEADRILEALRNNEKEIQKNLRKREGVRVRVEKDW
jgi:Ca-activated chloride channel family protein